MLTVTAVDDGEKVTLNPVIGAPLKITALLPAESTACALTAIVLLTVALEGLAVTIIAVAFPEKVTVTLADGTPDADAVTIALPPVPEVIAVTFAPVLLVVPCDTLRFPTPDLLYVTVVPLIFNGAPLASANWAVMLIVSFPLAAATDLLAVRTICDTG